jgi:hypothetical protein
MRVGGAHPEPDVVTARRARNIDILRHGLFTA